MYPTNKIELAFNAAQKAANFARVARQHLIVAELPPTEWTALDGRLMAAETEIRAVREALRGILPKAAL